MALYFSNGGQRPFALATGIGVVDKALFKGGLDMVDQPLLHNPIGKGGGKNFP
jgi:hypothetical protein